MTSRSNSPSCPVVSVYISPSLLVQQYGFISRVHAPIRMRIPHKQWFNAQANQTQTATAKGRRIQYFISKVYLPSAVRAARRRLTSSIVTAAASMHHGCLAGLPSPKVGHLQRIRLCIYRTHFNGMSRHFRFTSLDPIKYTRAVSLLITHSRQGGGCAVMTLHTKSLRAETAARSLLNSKVAICRQPSQLI